jgi:hypothetical protein
MDPPVSSATLRMVELDGARSVKGEALSVKPGCAGGKPTHGRPGDLIIPYPLFSIVITPSSPQASQ